jgi:hypothetical protein
MEGANLKLSLIHVAGKHVEFAGALNAERKAAIMVSDVQRCNIRVWGLSDITFILPGYSSEQIWYLVGSGFHRCLFHFLARRVEHFIH